MPIPLILGGIALAAAVTGVKKGFDAKNKNAEAKKLVKRAQRRFRESENELKDAGEALNTHLEEFAKFKLLMFTTRIKTLIDLIKKKRGAHSTLEDRNIGFSPAEIKELELTVSNSLEIASGIGKGLQSGALTAFGAYGSVGMLASASTGTAISTLGGAAATNATLAWLGGGSLAVGGGGMALGTAVLGGIVAGPLVAVAGFVMDSKAEKNLTEAHEYTSEIDIKIEKMRLSIEGLNAIHMQIDELQYGIEQIVVRLDNTFDSVCNVGILEKIKRLLGVSNICEHPQFDQLLLLGPTLREALNIPLLDNEGNANEDFKEEVKRITIS